LLCAGALGSGVALGAHAPIAMAAITTTANRKKRGNLGVWFVILGHLLET